MNFDKIIINTSRLPVIVNEQVYSINAKAYSVIEQVKAKEAKAYSFIAKKCSVIANRHFIIAIIYSAIGLNFSNYGT